MPRPDTGIADCKFDSAAAADEDEQFFGSGHSGVEQIAPEHDKVLIQQRHDHRRKFTALRLVNSDCIRRFELIGFVKIVGNEAVGIKADGKVSGIGIELDDLPEVAIENIFVIIIGILHHAVALFEYRTAELK